MEPTQDECKMWYKLFKEGKLDQNHSQPSSQTLTMFNDMKELLIGKFEDLKKDNEDAHARIEKKQDYTNGSVGKHEGQIRYFMGGAAVIMFVLTAILIPLAFIFIKDKMSATDQITKDDIIQIIEDNYEVKN